MAGRGATFFLLVVDLLEHKAVGRCAVAFKWSRCIKALIEKDVDLAKRNMDADSEVDQYEVDIDRLCLVILATRQPVARDLRFISTAFKIVTDLERISDLAVGISSRAIKLESSSSPTLSATSIPSSTRFTNRPET